MQAMADHSDNKDQESSFATLLGKEVTPHTHKPNRLRSNASVHKKKDQAALRDNATAEIEQVIDGLSSEAVEIVESEEELLFAIPGVQLRTLKRLRKGHIPWEAGIDLHGMSVDIARDELSHFIRDAHKQQCRCVIVVHGKSFSQSGQAPVLKSYVNDWLRQLHQVAAFCSAQPKDGGTGALYVLLRQGL